MKNFHLISWFVATVVLYTSCKKEDGGFIPTNSNPPPPAPSPIVWQNTPPKAYAGPDVYVAWPANSALLKGVAYDLDSNIKRYSWKKISGGSSLQIETPDSLSTKLNNLEKGSYELVLTVIDSAELLGTDTVKVIVKEYSNGPQEIIFNDQEWSCPMGCWISIENFYSFVPPRLPFKVFVKKTDEDVWVEALHVSEWDEHAKYAYDIYEGDLAIFAKDEEGGRVDVKILY